MKIVRAIALALLSAIAVYYALLFLGCAVFSLSYSALLAEMQRAAHNLTNAPLLLFMLASQTIAVFFTPAFVFLRLQHISLIEKTPLHLNFTLLTCAIAALVVWNIPSINLLSQLNTQAVLHLMPANSELVLLREQNEALQLFILNTPSLNMLALNLVVIAILPAIAEEVFFRGLVQQLLQRSTMNIHIVIATTALIFSVFHNDIFNVIPRFAMGLLFGYLFFTTKNITFPIVAHCVHNSTVIIVYFLIHNGTLSAQWETVGEWGNGMYISIVSIITMVFLMLWWWKRYKLTASASTVEIPM
jgi:membrane protease YdiL (CAAX protease family)